MIPLVDMHCHLFAGLDDGPRYKEEALAMCRQMVAEGVHLVAATAHQNRRYPHVTPQRIRESAQDLVTVLREHAIPLQVYPCAEVMADQDIEQRWQWRTILSLADRGEYILIELPHGQYLDLRPTVRQLRAARVRPILAHPERADELLHEPGQIEELIELGCLVQVSSRSVTHPASRAHEKNLRAWFRRGVVHFLGSDGHSLVRRPPHFAKAYRQIIRWAGISTADRICSTNGLAVLSGLPLRVAPPALRPRRWYARLW